MVKAPWASAIVFPRLVPLAPALASTKAVVASWVVLVPGAAVGAVGAPVSAGLADSTSDPVPVRVVVPRNATTTELAAPPT